MLRLPNKKITYKCCPFNLCKNIKSTHKFPEVSFYFQEKEALNKRGPAMELPYIPTHKSMLMEPFCNHKSLY